MPFLEFMGAVAILTFKLALVFGVLVGVFLLACFAIGWLGAGLRRGAKCPGWCLKRDGFVRVDGSQPDWDDPGVGTL